jgi:hypothetical protein
MTTTKATTGPANRQTSLHVTGLTRPSAKVSLR